MAENLGGGIALAIAAALWLLYLMPSWLRRREYLSTERNAVRLQQTMRVLAETAETPEELRVELSRRGVAEQQRVLRTAMRGPGAAAVSMGADPAPGSAERAAPAPRAARAHLAAGTSAGVTAAGRGPTPAQRLRRTRLATTLVLVIALAVLGTAVAPALSGGAVAWWSAGAALAVVVGAFAMLSAVQRSARRRRSTFRAMPQAATRPSRTASRAAAGSFVDPLAEPVAAPAAGLGRAAARPLLDAGADDADPAAAEPAAAASGPLPAPISAAVAAAQLRAESERATERLRAAERALPGVGDRAPAAQGAESPAARYARMGRVDTEQVAPGLTDLDGAFRRRVAGQ